tara:strand:- start:423 stop:635 length:213 start_codon:yes stop_codon:yes gene_type:complete
MTQLVSSDASEFPFVSYLWSDGTEVTFNRETREWASRQIPHPVMNPHRFTHIAFASQPDMTLAPDVGDAD